VRPRSGNRAQWGFCAFGGEGAGPIRGRLVGPASSLRLDGCETHGECVRSIPPYARVVFAAATAYPLEAPDDRPWRAWASSIAWLGPEGERERPLTPPRFLLEQRDQRLRFGDRPGHAGCNHGQEAKPAWIALGRTVPCQLAGAAAVPRRRGILRRLVERVCLALNGSSELGKSFVVNWRVNVP
jgi:hypothetical protein